MLHNTSKKHIADIIESHYIVEGCDYCDDCFDKCSCGKMLGEDTIYEHQADAIMHFLELE